MDQILHSDDFRPCVNTNFELAFASGERFSLFLRAVEEAINTARIESFSLFFIGPLTPILPQSTYRLVHEKLGQQDIFLVPIGPDGGGMQYEAVFNRLLPRP